MRVPKVIKALRGGASNTRRAIAEDEVAGAIRSGRHLCYGTTTRGLQSVGRQFNYAKSVFDTEWDLLIILDGCKYDLFDEVSHGNSFISSAEPMFSVAISSSE